MSRPPAQSSCTTECVLSAASAPARWPQEPRPSPLDSTSRAAQSACAGLTDPSRQMKIEAICFGPAQESGTEMRRAVRAACIVWALSVTPALAQDVTLLEKFKDWSAYAAIGSHKVCFAVAK